MRHARGHEISVTECHILEVVNESLYVTFLTETIINPTTMAVLIIVQIM